MVLIVPLVGLLAFGVVFVWFSYGYVKCSYGFNRLPSLVFWLSGFVFVWFTYVVRFSYSFNRPPRWSIGFRDLFRMVFLWFGIVFVWF